MIKLQFSTCRVLQYFGLDDVGSVIWAELAEERTVRDICGTVVEQFEIDDGRCKSDVIEFLDQLVQAGLVEISMSAKDNESTVVA